MEKTEVRLQVGDILRTGDEKYYLVVEGVGDELLECREVVRVPGNVIISGTSWLYVNADLDKYNKDMHEDGLRGVTHVYRFTRSARFPVSHGIVGNAYDMLTYGIDDFRIFIA